MTVVSIVLKITFLVLESLKFRSSPFSFHIVFPIIVHGMIINFNHHRNSFGFNSFFPTTGLTLIALSFSPKLLKKEILNDHENDEILKMCNGKPIYMPTKKKKKS